MINIGRPKFRFLTSSGFLLATLIGSLGATTPASSSWRVQFEPARIVNGSPVLFRVTAPADVKELTGSFLGQQLEFRRNAKCHCWYTLAGVSLDTKPDRYTLHLEGKA